MHNLYTEDINELANSGLSEEWIEGTGFESVTLDHALALGFRSSTPSGDENLLQDKYIRHCLFMPFKDIDGETCGVGIIKPRYTELAINTINDLPKYLCLPKTVQDRMHIHFPSGFDWQHFNGEQLFITEGLKKAEAACCKGIPCVALWSIWCFGENGTDSPLIRELKELITRTKEVFIVFDSDKSIKLSVSNAEQACVEKIFLETGKESKVINLPAQVKGKVTKGLDDFLLVCSVDEFYALVKTADSTMSTFTASRKRRSVPIAPIDQMPPLLSSIVEDIKSKYEGCHEMAVMSLFASVAVCMRNKIKLYGKTPNLYMIGIADTVSGKSTVAKKALSALSAIDSRLHYEYMQEEPSWEEDLDNVKF